MSAPHVERRDSPDTVESQRRADQLAKLHDKKPLGPADVECVRALPTYVDVRNLVHHTPLCAATFRKGADWNHRPFCQLTRRVQQGAEGEEFLDRVRFNDQAFQRLGLQPKMKLALYTDRKACPRVLVIQNVVRDFEFPALLHKLGTFTVIERPRSLQDNSFSRHKQERVYHPDTFTESGFIGYTKFSPYPMSLLWAVPDLIGRYFELWRVEEHEDLLFALLEEGILPPDVLVDKMRRQGLMVESDHRPYRPEDFVKSLEKTMRDAGWL